MEGPLQLGHLAAKVQFEALEWSKELPSPMAENAVGLVCACKLSSILQVSVDLVGLDQPDRQRLRLRPCSSVAAPGPSPAAEKIVEKVAKTKIGNCPCSLSRREALNPIGAVEVLGALT